jgi:hypothetical protein
MRDAQIKPYAQSKTLTPTLSRKREREQNRHVHDTHAQGRKASIQAHTILNLTLRG